MRSFVFAAALSCMAFASFLMAQQQQWTVRVTLSDGAREAFNYQLNASPGALIDRDSVQETNGTTSVDHTYYIRMNEVAFGDPELRTEYRPAVWRVSVDCRPNSENGGKCINDTDNQRGGTVGLDSMYIFFSTEDDASAFLRYYRR